MESNTAPLLKLFIVDIFLATPNLQNASTLGEAKPSKPKYEEMMTCCTGLAPCKKTKKRNLLQSSVSRSESQLRP